MTVYLLWVYLPCLLEANSLNVSCTVPWVVIFAKLPKGC